MCDNLCLVGPEGTLFAKNSDRPPDEPQPVAAYGARESGGTLVLRDLELPDAGAARVIGSRPDWLWGFEHGVNEHRVAIGNEAVYTRDAALPTGRGLIGMDIVRLGLERGTSADHAVEVMTALLEEHGQAGPCSPDGTVAYHSSFLVADPAEAWILETSARSWAAKRVSDAAAISNRISLGSDWTRASGDVTPGSSFDEWRDPDVDTGFADVRLASSLTAIARLEGERTPGDLVAHLRDHGSGPWAAPGDTRTIKSLPPPDVFSVCMHIPGAANTTSAMICELPSSPERPMRAWVALGSPCVSVFVPVFPPDDVPVAFADPKTWARFAALRDRVERDRHELFDVRAVLGALEAQLWSEAEEIAGDASARRAFVAAAWARVDEALDRLV